MKKKRKKKAGEDGIKALGVFLMESRNHFVFHSEFEIFGTSRVSLLEIWIDGANFQIINNLILAISFSNSRHLILIRKNISRSPTNESINSSSINLSLNNSCSCKGLTESNKPDRATRCVIRVILEEA